MLKTTATLVLALVTIHTAAGQDADLGRKVPVRQRAVDVVILNDGTRLLGVLAPAQQPAAPQDKQEKDAGSTRILCRTEWLSKHAPDVLAHAQPSAEHDGADGQPRTLESLLAEHIADLQQHGDATPERLGFLQVRLDQLRDARVRPGEQKTRLVVLHVANDLIRQKLQHPANVQQLAFLGILNAVPDVEELAQPQLEKRLREIPAADLVQQLPATGPAAAEQKFQTLLIATDSLFGRTCRLIEFNGDFLVDEAADEAKVAEIAATLIARQARTQLAQLLDEALDGPSAANSSVNAGGGAPVAMDVPDAARTIAEQQGADILRISRLNLDIPAASATVSVHIYYHDRSGNRWHPAGFFTETASARDVQGDQAQQLGNNPQLKSMLALFEGLGASSQDVSKALSMGAVVRIAQERTATAVQKAINEATSVDATAGELSALRLSSLPTDKRE